MIISYAGISLEVAHLRSWDRQPIYDGPTFIYQQHTIRARCYYNPGATSYALIGGRASVPAGAGAAAVQGARGNIARVVQVPLRSVAPITDTAIRHVLSQPRQKLIIKVGTVDVLVSPRPDFETDSHNGPTPLQWDVVQISGTKTYIVDFAIQVSLSECYLFRSNAPHAILSHRWRMSVETDQDGYTTRTIQGRAIFDTAKLLASGGQADDFREAIFHPIPKNFARVQIKVDPAEDGSEVAYTVVDRERPINYLVPATRIECFKYNRIIRPGALTVLKATLGGAIQHGRQFAHLGAALGASAVPGSAAAAGVALGVPAAIGGAAYEGIMASIPMQEIGLVIRVWGNRESSRKLLENIAINMAGKMFAQIEEIVRISASVECDLTHDMMGKFVELKVSLSKGLPETNLIFDNAFVNALGPPVIGAAVGAAGAAVQFPQVQAIIREQFGLQNRLPDLFQIRLPDVGNAFSTLDGVEGFTTGNTIDNPPAVGPFIPRQRQQMTRGTYIGSIVAQALQAPCQDFDSPFDPGDANERDGNTGKPLKEPVAVLRADAVVLAQQAQKDLVRNTAFAATVAAAAAAAGVR